MLALILAACATVDAAPPAWEWAAGGPVPIRAGSLPLPGIERPVAALERVHRALVYTRPGADPIELLSHTPAAWAVDDRGAPWVAELRNQAVEVSGWSGHGWTALPPLSAPNLPRSVTLAAVGGAVRVAWTDSEGSTAKTWDGTGWIPEDLHSDGGVGPVNRGERPWIRLAEGTRIVGWGTTSARESEGWRVHRPIAPTGTVGGRMAPGSAETPVVRDALVPCGWRVPAAAPSAVSGPVRAIAATMSGELRVCRFADGWTLLHPVPADGDVTHTAIAARGEEIVVAWREIVDGLADVRVARWQNGRWSGFEGAAPDVLSDGGGPEHVAIAATADEVCVTWTARSGRRLALSVRCHR